MPGRTSAIEDKRVAATFSAAMVGAVVWPITQNWRTKKQDGFPLSYYPMFSAKREDIVRCTYLVGLTATGERRSIPYCYAGTGGLNQVRRQLRRLARAGEGQAVCAAVAERLAARHEGSLTEVVTVQLARGEYRLARFAGGDKAPLRERVYGSQEIDREPS